FRMDTEVIVVAPRITMPRPWCDEDGATDGIPDVPPVEVGPRCSTFDTERWVTTTYGGRSIFHRPSEAWQVDSVGRLYCGEAALVLKRQTKPSVVEVPKGVLR